MPPPFSASRRLHLKPSLDAQGALLPYALCVFAVSLPVYVWAGSFAPNAAWMAGSFAIFAINFGVFYGVVNWLRGPQAEDVSLRLRVHLLCGLLWAVAVAQIAAFGDAAGAVREPILMIAVAGAAVCCFFAAPVLPVLLTIAPVASAAPLIALLARPHNGDLAPMAVGGLSLTLALCLVLNRLLRRQFSLAAEREILIADRAASLQAAERLARSKSDIVATLSHEIRNGLTGVIHVLAAASGRGGRAAPSRDQLGAALDAANNLIAVLNATLDSETAETGSLTLEVQSFDPVRLVRDVVLLHRPAAAGKGLELSIHTEAEFEQAGGGVTADPARVRQILVNLVGNAVKYTVRGRVEVRIERRGERVAIEVADTGPGLSDEEMDRAFEPFRRVERTGAGVPGAGLGLSLSRRLADLMDGCLTARSAPGAGSCFCLELPFDPAACPPAAVEPAAAQAAPGEMARPLRVLVAEDDALNAAMLRAILEQLGHQVVHAQNGRRAIELAKVCDFDLTMIDGRMPEMDGPQTAAALRALPSAVAQAPMVAVIGGDAEEATECLAAGADIVLRKPVTVGGVARAVAEALGYERAGSSAPSAAIA